MCEIYLSWMKCATYIYIFFKMGTSVTIVLTRDSVHVSLMQVNIETKVERNHEYAQKDRQPEPSWDKKHTHKKTVLF